MFSVYPELECASAGTNNDPENPLTAEMVAWAQVIFVMEKAHRNTVNAKCQRQLKNKRLICIDMQGAMLSLR